MKATSEQCWNRRRRLVEWVRQTTSRPVRYSLLQTIRNGSRAKRCLSQVACVNNSPNEKLTKRKTRHAIRNCRKRERRRHPDLLQRLGKRTAHRVQPRLAA